MRLFASILPPPKKMTWTTCPSPQAGAARRPCPPAVDRVLVHVPCVRVVMGCVVRVRRGMHEAGGQASLGEIAEAQYLFFCLALHLLTMLTPSLLPSTCLTTALTTSYAGGRRHGLWSWIRPSPCCQSMPCCSKDRSPLSAHMQFESLDPRVFVRTSTPSNCPPPSLLPLPTLSPQV